MNTKQLIRILSYALVAVLSSVLTLTVVMYGRSDAAPSKLDQLQQIILENFIGDADQKALEDAAAGAMVEALGDEWSYYMSAEEYAVRYEQQQNAYVGIGVSISDYGNGEGLVVVNVTSGGPAEAAGILPQDRIVGIDGQSILGMEKPKVLNLIQGDAGTQVTLELLRGEERIEIAVTRDAVRIPVVEAQLLENEIGLIKVNNFDANCASETMDAIDLMMEQGATKLIFDMRFNPGGRVSELVKVLDRLLPEGVIFRSEYSDGKTDERFSDMYYLDMPMAVLVNVASYSASEYFAAVLSEYDAAVVVGEKTYGKGYCQRTYKLPDGSAVGLSIGKYCTPKGVNLAGVGLTPDIVVPVDEKTTYAIYAGTLDPSDDPQIQAAVEALLKP